MTQAAFVIARFLMRYDVMEKPIGQDNLRKGWQTVLSPGNGVKMRFKIGADKRALNLLSFPYEICYVGQEFVAPAFHSDHDRQFFTNHCMPLMF
jgi:hypothetical protein